LTHSGGGGRTIRRAERWKGGLGGGSIEGRKKTEKTNSIRGIGEVGSNKPKSGDIYCFSRNCQKSKEGEGGEKGARLHGIICLKGKTLKR